MLSKQQLYYRARLDGSVMHRPVDAIEQAGSHAHGHPHSSLLAFTMSTIAFCTLVDSRYTETARHMLLKGQVCWWWQVAVGIDHLTGSECLVQELSATNLGDSAFELTAALHTYFAISHISQVCSWLESMHR